MNLVAPYAEQPTVHEVRRSSRRRVLAALTVARTGLIDAEADLAGFRIEVVDAATAIAIGPDGQVAWFAVGGHGRRAVLLGGCLIEGPGLRIARIDGDGDGLAGEAIGQVAGVIRLERPGPLDLRRQPDGSVEIGTTGGFALDPLWSRRPLTALFQLGAQGWLAAGRLDLPGIVPNALVRAFARQTGHGYVRLRLEP